MGARMNVIEDGDYRYTLFPDHLDWYYQPRSEPEFGVEPRMHEVDYDFARNEFDHLLFCVTNRCNITCDYCFRGFNMKKRREIDFDEFRAVADHFLARARHKPTFQFTGGEVFVKQDIDDWFEYIHERGFRIWMTTNGVSPRIRESQRFRRVFEGNPMGHVRVSCDGHRADLYERHRGGPGTFAKVEQNLRYLVSIGVPTSVKTVVTPENFPFIEEMLEWAYDLGLVGWNYNVMRYTGAMAPMPPSDATCRSKGHIEYVGYTELGRKLTDILRRKPHLAPLLDISRYGKILDTLYAPRPHGVRMLYYMLNFDGEVYLNDNLSGPEHSRGNIWRDGMAAFNGLAELRATLDDDLPCCQRCPIHRFCFQKGDYGELAQRGADLSGEFPNCGDIRRHFTDTLALRDEGKTLFRLVTKRSVRFPPPH
jgi:MoaA/NifB/PqqE/SkfB family radical SAM enzyme